MSLKLYNAYRFDGSLFELQESLENFIENYSALGYQKEYFEVRKCIFYLLLCSNIKENKLYKDLIGKTFYSIFLEFLEKFKCPSFRYFYFTRDEYPDLNIPSVLIDALNQSFCIWNLPKFYIVIPFLSDSINMGSFESLGFSEYACYDNTDPHISQGEMTKRIKSVQKFVDYGTAETSFMYNVPVKVSSSHITKGIINEDFLKTLVNPNLNELVYGPDIFIK